MLAADDAGLAALKEWLPPLARGRTRYPLVLPRHSAARPTLTRTRTLTLTPTPTLTLAQQVAHGGHPDMLEQ